MKILVVNTFYAPHIVGGAEVSVQLLAEELLKNGNEVAVFCVDHEEKGIQKENVNGVQVYRSDSGNFHFYPSKNNTATTFQKIKNRFIGMQNRYVGKRYQEVLKEYQPDVVHINNICGLSSLLWNITKKQHIPCVQTVRDYYIKDPIGKEEGLSFLQTVEKKLHRAIYHYRSKQVDYVTAPSKFILDQFLKEGYFPKAKSTYVYNSVKMDLQQTFQLLEEREKRQEKQIDFLYVGRFSKEKGIENLLQAFSQIDNPDLRLHFCGTGELEKLVKTYVEQDSRIDYHGMLKKEELASVYQLCDVVIVPSLWEEPFGRVVIEGNQYGLPILGSNRGGIKETLDQIHTGLTFQYDDVKDLQEKIEFFSHRETIKTFFDPIRKGIEAYKIEVQAERYEQIYQEAKEG